MEQWQYDALASYDIDVERYFEDENYRDSLHYESDPIYQEHLTLALKICSDGIKTKKQNEYKDKYDGTNKMNQKTKKL